MTENPRPDLEAEIDELVEQALPWVREQARQELERRSDRLTPTPLNLALGESLQCWLSGVFRISSERDYRRGYYHGFSDGMDAVRDAAGKSKVTSAAWLLVAKFFDDDLYDWR